MTATHRAFALSWTRPHRRRSPVRRPALIAQPHPQCIATLALCPRPTALTRTRAAGQRDRSLFYHPSSLEEVIWQCTQSLLRVSLGEDTWALPRNSVTKGGRLEMACARASGGEATAPLMVAHIDVDQEGECSAGGRRVCAMLIT